MTNPLRTLALGSVALIVFGFGVAGIALGWLWQDGRRTCC